MSENPYEAPQTDSEGHRNPGKCPLCGDANYREGTLSMGGTSTVVFVPDNWPFLRIRVGLRAKALACVNCGHLRFFIAQKDLSSLQGDS